MYLFHALQCIHNVLYLYLSLIVHLRSSDEECDVLHRRKENTR